MSDQIKPIPEGYHTVTPYLVVQNAADAITFYQQAFDAIELFRLPTPEGKVAHAEIKIGNSPIMLGDECPEMGARSPQTLGGTPLSLMVYVEDVDTVVDRAVFAGAKLERAVQDQFYGDRTGTILDPFGHQWTIATHKEDVAPEELQRRMEAMSQGGGESEAAAS